MRLISALTFILVSSAFAQGPHPVRTQSIEYPLIALQAGVKGRVVLKCLLTASGKVESVTTMLGPQILTEAAIANVTQWLFSPANDNSNPEARTTPRSIEISYIFEIRGTTDRGRSPTTSVIDYPNVVTVSAARPSVMVSSR